MCIDIQPISCQAAPCVRGDLYPSKLRNFLRFIANFGSMQAEIISIGDELLLGQTINTNAAWMGQQLYAVGIEIHQVTTITDKREHILRELKAATERVDLVFITGGLGPTQDDITKETLCDFFNTKLVMNEEVLHRIRAYFKSRNLQVLPENEQQAELPEDAEILPNRRGTAMGMWFNQQGKAVISMPGVPHEMEGMMREEVLPRLEKRYSNGGSYYTVVQTIGKGESFIANELRDWEKRIRGEGLGLAYLPSSGMVRLRISGPKQEKARVEAETDKVVEVLGDIVFARDESSLSEVVGKLLREKQMTMAVAESCTGGTIAQMITSVPGSSDYFAGGAVAYSIHLKQTLLGVDASVIEQHGVVSEQVVGSMAEGVRKQTGADVALATTGVAGPGGGTDQVPVGTVWIGLSSPAGIISKKYTFGRNRDRNIKVASLFALDLLRRHLLSVKVSQ